MSSFHGPRIRTTAVAISSPEAVVMLSGGLDSTVALWWALDHYRRVRAVSLDYGQRHRQELRAAARLSALAGVELSVVRLRLPHGYRPERGMFIRGHTILMSAIGAIGIDARGADIVLGMLATDPYADCGPDYLRSLSAGLRDPLDGGPTHVVAPLLAVEDKSAAAAMGFELGAPWHLSWSCREPRRGRPCEACPACRSRADVGPRMGDRYGLRPAEVERWQASFGSPRHPAFGRCSEELHDLGRRFAAAGGVIDGERGFRYVDPEGTERLAPHLRVRRRTAWKIRGGRSAQYVRARGVSNGVRWQVAVCADGSVAVTEKLPSLAVLEEALVRAVGGA
ncbi:7-cyano-7-deazaguanine synthase [Cellulomonas sp. S1-8]|uniref:7-cyano-7-deazaguanine synthase n=1 Tax=Cellulomonas sp. S1-8 TaxID=2904790 RepID=UPI002243DBA6|nr:7-cyano-7-deazaguanine synthase [Cellulomonas sp. S1-8]UZN02104.1 7-cyano-7-deazaguanine synthase [Cellulomonas sp. S1-8]